MDQASDTAAAHPIRLVVVLIALALSAATAYGAWYLATHGWALWPVVGTGVALLAAGDSWIAAARPAGAWPIWLRILTLF